MARQRLTIGTFGEIGYLPGPSGRVVARARYRDWDGKNRLVQATGETRKQAERALKAKLADRSCSNLPRLTCHPTARSPTS